MLDLAFCQQKGPALNMAGPFNLGIPLKAVKHLDFRRVRQMAILIMIYATICIALRREECLALFPLNF